MVNLQADASLSVAAAGLTSGLPYVLPWFLDTTTQNLNNAEKNVIGTALRADVALASTATLTADAIRNANVDSTLAVTATIPTISAGRVANVDAQLGVIASSFDSAPVAYDATGVGAVGGAATTTLTWNHTATAGADVFAFIIRGGGNITATHDGVAMTYVGAISPNNDAGNGTIYVFRRASVPGGTKAIVVTFGAGTYCAANSVSYLNVGAVTTSATYGAPALTASQSITGARNGVIVNVQGMYCGGVDTFVSSSGGTQRWQGIGTGNYMNLVIQDSTSTGSVNFTSTVTATNTVWGSFGMVLTPPPPTSTRVKGVDLLSTVSTGAQPNAYSINWNHTIESDATMLVVAWGELSTQFYTSVTVNGLTMTKVLDWVWVVNGFVGWINVHYYINPPPGLQNIVISGGGTGAYMSATSLTFRNAQAFGTQAVGTGGVISGAGPNDFLLNVVSGWNNGQAGFTGYNGTLISADLTTVGMAAIFGYARGSSATFSVANLLANYGGWGNAVLPIKPMIDQRGDAPLAATATITSAGYLARQADAPLALTAGITANSIRTAQIDATLPVTTSVSGAHLVNLHGDSPLAITAAPSGGALRNANVDSTQIITASRTSNVIWATTGDSTQAITADMLGFTTPPSYDSVGAGYTSGGSGGSWSHTMVNASVICVSIMCGAASGATVNIDGTINVPQVGPVVTIGSNAQYLYMFALTKPPQGAHTINVVNANAYLVGGSVAYRNAWVVDPLQSATGSGTTETQVVTASTGSLVVQVFAAYGSQAQSGYNQTARYYGWGNGSTWPMMMGDAPGAASVTFTATMSNSAWAGVAVVLRPGTTNAIAGRTANTALPITTTIPATTTWQIKTDSTQAITATITANSLRNANVDATLPVTASRTANVTWVLAANVAQTITATLQASELRLVNVDAAMPVTVGRLGTGNVAYDSTGVGATNSAAGGFTLSWNHTIGATANYVVMAISHLTNGASTYTAKCGGVTMTLLGITLNYQTSPGPYSTYVYGLMNPPTGTQSMTFQTSANYNYVAGNSVAYSGVGSVAGVFTQSLVGNASFSQTVPSLSNQMLFNAWASDGLARTTAPSYSQTQRSWLPEVDNINPLLFIGDAAGTGSPVTFSGTANASGNWGGVTIALSPLGPTAVTGIRGDVTEAITATLTTTYLRNAIVNATQQIIANRTGAIVVDLHGNATLPVTTTATGAGVRNAMVDSTIAVTASRTANSNWYAYADATQTITPRGLGLETVSPPTWVGTGPGKSQGTSPLTYTDTIPVGTTYTLLFGQLLCASATLPTVSATIGGVTATLVDSAYISSNSGNYLYGVCLALANPPTGSQTVSFTSNSILACAVNTVHYSGVGSLGPVSKIGQQAGQPSFSVGTDAKYGYAQAFLYAVAAAGNGFSSYNQNQRWTISAVLNVNGPLLIGDATGNGGTLTFSATRDNTTNGWGAIVVPLAPVSAGAIYGATAATALPITATRLANVTWAAKAAALQQVTASPAAEYSRGQPASATQSITAIPDSTGSRGQTVESTETITVSTDAIGSRGQDIDSPLVVTADLLSMVTWQGWFDAAQVITASDTANAIWALRANAAQQITASYTALASYGATGNALLPITASPLLSNVTWDAQALSDLIVTASTSTIGSRWQPIDSTQAITALLSGVGSRGQFVDSTLGLTIAALPAAISYGATGNAPLVITVNLLTSDTLLDNHAYAAMAVSVLPEANVIWDTTGDSGIAITARRWVTMGQVVNIDAALSVTARVAALFKGFFGFDAAQTVTATPTSRVVRGQLFAVAQTITAAPAGGIVWHGRIGAPLRITATPLGNAIWDAHANSQMTVTESGLIVVSRGQDIDPALDITADTSGEFTQTMSGDVEQAILALPDTELSLGSAMDSALSLIVTYSADIGEALRGGNFFYFYL